MARKAAVAHIAQMDRRRTWTSADRERFREMAESELLGLARRELCALRDKTRRIRSMATSLDRNSHMIRDEVSARSCDRILIALQGAPPKSPRCLGLRHRRACRRGHVRQYRLAQSPRLYGHRAAVNIASRLEALTKEVKRSVLFSKAFVERAGCESKLEDVGSYPLRGLSEPVTAYAFATGEVAGNQCG